MYSLAFSSQLNTVHSRDPALTTPSSTPPPHHEWGRKQKSEEREEDPRAPGHHRSKAVWWAVSKWEPKSHMLTLCRLHMAHGHKLDSLGLGNFINEKSVKQKDWMTNLESKQKTRPLKSTAVPLSIEVSRAPYKHSNWPMHCHIKSKSPSHQKIESTGFNTETGSEHLP